MPIRNEFDDLASSVVQTLGQRSIKILSYTLGTYNPATQKRPLNETMYGPITALRSANQLSVSGFGRGAKTNVWAEDVTFSVREADLVAAGFDTTSPPSVSPGEGVLIEDVSDSNTRFSVVSYARQCDRQMLVFTCKRDAKQLVNQNP